MGSGTYLPTSLGLSALDGGWTGSSSSHLPPYPQYPQVIPTESNPIQGKDEQDVTTYPESLPPLTSRSTLPGPPGMREALGRQYVCGTCGKQYSQPQGVSRHRQRAHSNPHSCFDLHCAFKWTRPCQYGAHLKKCHRGVDPNIVLGKPTGSRRRSTIIGRDLPQHLYPPPTIEPDQRSRAELWRRPMTQPLPPVANVTHALPPALSPVAYNLRPEYADPAITAHKHEVSPGLDVLIANNTPTSSPTEERAESVKSNQRGQFWLLPAPPGGSTAANHPSSSVGFPPHSPRLLDSIRVFVNPMVEPAGSVYSRLFSAVGFDEVWGNTSPPPPRSRHCADN